MRWWWICLALAAPAAALGQDSVPVMDVRLSNFDFDPETIRLRADQPVVLRLTNNSRGGHNFSARQFFAAASIPADQRGPIDDGEIEVPSGQTVSVRLVPARGRYRLRCTHTLHGTFGMRGEIVVE